MSISRLEKQIQFLLEIDKLKSVFRRSLIVDASRRENDAEHSWHFALLAIVLAEYADEPGLDLSRVLKMALIHDLVEVYAGDTYIYDSAGRESQVARELKAAEKLFGLLPEDQGEEFRGIWDEFEEKKTKEARFAGALDRLQPLLLNFFSGGASWTEHGITSEQVYEANSKIGEGSAKLWEFARGIIRDAMDKGYLIS